MAKHKASHEPSPEDEAARRAFPWTPKAFWVLTKRSVKEWVEDKSPKQAAALAYYTLFAIGPLLVLAISVAALVLSAEQAREAVTGQFGRLVGPAGQDALAELMEGAASRDRAGLIGTIVGLVVLVFAAMAVFGQLKEALNRIWEIEARSPEGWKAKLKQAVRKNILSFAGVLGTGFLLLVSLVLSSLLAAVAARLGEAIPGSALLWQALNMLLTLVLVGLVFAAIFRYLPDAKVAWRDVGVGAAVTAVLFMVGEAALGFYLGQGAMATRYGAAGAVLALLVWVYYSSLIVFLGAEFTQVYANLYGSRVRPSDEGRTLQRAVREDDEPPHREGIDREKERAPGGRGRGAT